MTDSKSSVPTDEAPPPYNYVTSMEKNLLEAEALRAANYKIAWAAITPFNKTFISFSYDLSFSATGVVSMTEVKQEVKVSDYLGQFQNTTATTKPLEEIFDMFNDNIDYGAFNTWSDVNKHNDQLGKLITKFGMLRENDQTRKMAAQLRVNMVRINEVLERIEKALQSEPSRLQQMTNEVAQVNASIAQLKLKSGVLIKPKVVQPIVSIDSLILIERKDLVANLKEWYPNKKWELLYRGSRDGFGAADFHRTCDNKGPTCTIIRSDNGSIFGGFTSTSWNSSSAIGWISCNDASLFSLVNPVGIASKKYTVKSSSNATLGRGDYGPTFGGGHDLHICDNSNTMRSSYHIFPHSYTDTTGRGNLTFTGTKDGWLVSEIEVFALLEKQIQ